MAAASSALRAEFALASVAPADVTFDARVPCAELDALFPRGFGIFDKREAAVTGLGTEDGDRESIAYRQGVAEHRLGVAEPIAVGLAEGGLAEGKGARQRPVRTQGTTTKPPGRVEVW